MCFFIYNMYIMENKLKYKIIFWDLDGTLISLEIAEKNDAYIISDEIYDRLVYGDVPQGDIGPFSIEIVI